ncbi:Dabb family protein [Nocardia sp. NPDC004750]
MIYHCNRLTLKPGVTQEQLDEALESLRNQGRVIPSVRHFSVGRGHGGECECGAVFALDDFDGYREYLIHPAHPHTDRIGLPRPRRSPPYPNGHSDRHSASGRVSRG